MPKQKLKKMPKRFSVLKITAVSLLIGTLLTVVNTIPINLKTISTIVNMNSNNISKIKGTSSTNDSLSAQKIYKTNALSTIVEQFQKTSFTLLLPLIIIMIWYHFPLYLFFIIRNREKWNPDKKEKLRLKCKQKLFNSPLFCAGSIFIWYAVSIFSAYVFKADVTDNYLSQLSTNYFLILMITAALTTLFLYLWQNHRVKTYFVPQVFTVEELRERQCKSRSLKIKRQLILSTVITTCLPLLLMLFYLFNFVTVMPFKNNLNSDQMKIVFGNYPDQFTYLGVDFNSFLKNIHSVIYFNAVDTFMLSLSIFIGISVALFYLFCITRWTIAEILIPLKELQELSRKISQGDFDEYAVVRNNDEIGELSEGFNIMVEYISSIIEQITRLNNELSGLNRNLEQKVEERTVELKSLNGELQTEVEERVRAEEALLKTNEKLRIRNEMMEGELEMARKIQIKLLPHESPHSSIATYYKPMEKVGGDFYDFIRFTGKGKDHNKHSDNIGIFISDVSGHGVPAAFITSLIKGAFSQAGDLFYEPADLMYYMNDFLITQTSGDFITAFYGIYNRSTREFVYSNAGHNNPYIIKDGFIQELPGTSSGIPLAILDNEMMRDMKKKYANESIRLSENSKLLLYTDGLIEAVNIHEKINNEKALDFESACLKEAVMELHHESSTVFVNKMAEKLIHFRGSDNFDDDVCMICIDVE